MIEEAALEHQYVTGKAEGKAEGEADTKREVALKMLAKNLDDETIIECSRITPDELSKLKKSR
jgi:hypothetical protein